MTGALTGKLGGAFVSTRYALCTQKIEGLLR